MRLIAYQEFSRLRLRDFLPAPVQIMEQDGFEWMEGVWHYEGIGFTWFGRLAETPDETGGLEVFFEELSGSDIARIFEMVGCSLFAGMTKEQIIAELGPAGSTVRFADDRHTSYFTLGFPEQYDVGCTIHDENGLIHASMIRSDILRKLVARGR